MKTITILPQKLLHLIETNKMHMALAHLIDAPGMQEYTDFYKAAAVEETQFVILDNGVIETGTALPINILMDKANKLGASELVLPDYFLNGVKTLELLEESYHYLKNCSLADISNSWMQFMAVPQGDSFSSWMSCACTIIDTYSSGGNKPMIATLGIPKVLTHLAGRDARMFAVDCLYSIYPDLFNYVDIHFLGCWDSPLELYQLNRVAQDNRWDGYEVRSVDSCLPYVYARANKTFNECGRPDSNPIDFKDGECDFRNKLFLNLCEWHSIGGVSKNDL